MTKICTSIEQSKKLIELGIDANTADMCYHFPETNKFPICLTRMKVHKDEKEDSIPAWSLSALLELIPSYILKNSNVGINKYNIWIAERKSPVWCETPLDAAFETICWLLKNGKI